MTWFKVDDGFWSHPKSAPLSNNAVALWVRAGAYCCQHLTDGFVKASVLRMVGDKDSAIELVASGLWIDVPGGWKFHDWDEYQETRDVVKKRRDDARERQRRTRELREKRRSESHRESRVTDTVTSQEVFNPRPDPTRPDPTSSSSGQFRGVGGVAENARNEPPPTRCQKHINNDTPPPCGRCKDAREAREAWDRANSTALTNSAAHERKAVRQAINDCALCDDLGWVLGVEPVRKCSHERRSA